MVNDCKSNMHISKEEFIEKHLKLIELEREYEILETRSWLDVAPPKALQDAGVCLTCVKLVKISTGLFGRSILKFTNSKGSSALLPDHSFSSGDIVGVFLSSNATSHEKDQVCSGLVHKLSSENIVIAVDTSPEDLEIDEEQNYRLVKLSNDVTYKRLKSGLEKLKSYSSGPSDVIINALFNERKLQEPLVSLPPTSLNSSSSLKLFNEKLDESQKTAVRFALSRKDLACIHGPPGTGKTTTVIEIILHYIAAGNKVLACAPSNVAVDNLLQRLSEQSKIRLVRLGHPCRMQSTLNMYSLDSQVHRSEQTDIVKDVKSDLENHVRMLRKGKKKGESPFHLREEIRKLRKEMYERETRAVKDVLLSADVILCTLTTATSEGPLKHLPVDHFQVTVIDECSQATEAACWLALLKAPRALVAGDPLQLPPTVLSPQAEKQGLSISLMERAIALHGSTITHLLCMQYRMHEAIMDWASAASYKGQLEAHLSVKGHLLKDLPYVEENDDTGLPLVFVDTAGCGLDEDDSGDSKSCSNTGEAAIIAAHVRCLLAAGVKQSDIAVITPYNLQVELVKLMLADYAPQVEVRSVDGFQGREKEVVLLSLVRSNAKREIGFVADARRLNVAVTRARRQLFLVANSDMFEQHPFIKGLLEYMNSKGDVRTAHSYKEELDLTSLKTCSVRPKFRIPKEVAKKPKNKNVKKKDQTLEGSFKTAVKSDGSQCQDRDEELRKQFDAFVESSRQQMVFPATLTSYERRLIHEWAEACNLQHESVGEAPERFIQLMKNKPKSVIAIPKKSAHADVYQAQVERKEEPEEAREQGTSEAELTDSNSNGLPDYPTKTCPVCSKLIPETNLSLHVLRCKPVVVVPEVNNSKPVSVKPKKAPKTSRKKEEQEEEDIEKLLGEFKTQDNTCSFPPCKEKLSCLGQLCSCCRKRYCLAHHIPEIHGCGAKARQAARLTIIKEGVLYRGSGVPSKKPDPVKRAHLQRKLDKKLTDLEEKRAGKGKKREE